MTKTRPETMARRMAAVYRMMKVSPDGLTATDIVKGNLLATKAQALEVLRAMVATGYKIWSEPGLNGAATYFTDFEISDDVDALTEALRVDNFYRQILDPAKHYKGLRLLRRKDWNGIGGSYVELPKGVWS